MYDKYVIVITNCWIVKIWSFAKFTKFCHCQSFPLYSRLFSTSWQVSSSFNIYIITFKHYCRAWNKDLLHSASWKMVCKESKSSLWQIYRKPFSISSNAISFSVTKSATIVFMNGLKWHFLSKQSLHTFHQNSVAPFYKKNSQHFVPNKNSHVHAVL